MFGLVLGRNPLFTGEPVGGAFFNLILLGYGLPAVLAIALALMHARHAADGLPRDRGRDLAVALALAYLSLEVRTLFHGPVLTVGPTTRCRAIHLFGGVARLRRGAAAGRHLRCARSRRGSPRRR